MWWEGFTKETGRFHGRDYQVVLPNEAAEGKPYFWRTEFPGAFPSADIEMLKKGYAMVNLGISDQYGCPAAVNEMEAFQTFIEETYGFAKKVILFGFSRGGLYAVHYAARCPERIEVIYLDAPVVDIYSWPGGVFSGEGAGKEWEECKALWNMERDEYMALVNREVAALLENRIPMILVAGGADTVVPYTENGLLYQNAYEKSDVPFRMIMKPECGHHPHSLEDAVPIVDFLTKKIPGNR